MTLIRKLTKHSNNAIAIIKILKMIITKQNSNNSNNKLV